MLCGFHFSGTLCSASRISQSRHPYGDCVCNILVSSLCILLVDIICNEIDVSSEIHDRPVVDGI